jgi:hypothetical protein
VSAARWGEAPPTKEGEPNVDKLNRIFKELVESKEFFEWTTVEELRAGDIVPSVANYYEDDKSDTMTLFRLLMQERIVVIGRKEEEGMVTVWVASEDDLDHNGKCDLMSIAHFFEPVGKLWARYADEKDARVKV